jgi:hypothetical protein
MPEFRQPLQEIICCVSGIKEEDEMVFWMPQID